MRFPLVAALLALATVASAQTTSPRHGFNWDNNEAQNRNWSKLDGRIPLGGGNRPVFNQIFCGNLANNNTTYFSPGAVGTTSAASNLMDLNNTACQSESNTAEATADEPIYKGTLRVLSMCCEVSGTGSNGAVFTARSAAAILSPSLTVTIPTGVTSGCAVPTSYANVPTIAAGATVAIQNVTTENLSAQFGLCVLSVELQ